LPATSCCTFAIRGWLHYVIGRDNARQLGAAVFQEAELQPEMRGRARGG
jgi:hypothetical protein